ncbi:MAG: hypothetical protein R3285_09425 [Kiloniellales bacterium]|nr:hypothetical protein [Kiloniellales bacterium]
MRGLRCLAALALLLAAGRAGAQEVNDALGLDAFFGHWRGTAIGQRADEPTTGYGVRDLDVRISETTDGFEIAWTTVIQAAGVAAEDAEPKRRRTSARFVQTGPAVWQGESTDGPGVGLSRSWARLEGRSLTVYVLEIDEAGLYDLSRYARTISPAGVMDLKFTRTRDGAALRRVTGSLLPAAD